MEDTIQYAIQEAITDVLNDHQENGSVATLSVASLESLGTLFQESGFFNLLMPEEHNGAALSLPQVLPILMQEGRYALPIGLSSTNLANLWLHTYGIDLPSGAIALEASMSTSAENASLQSMSLGLKPESFAQTTPYLLLAHNDQAYLIEASQYQLASVDSDKYSRWLSVDLTKAKALAVSAEALSELRYLAVLATIATSLGAMRQVLEMTVKYAAERSQFGRTLSQFQAIQQQLSVMAECVCSAQMAAELAYNSQDTEASKPHIMLAKHQISLVANQVANIAHAVHGAIGITKEFPLHFYTQIIRQNRSRGGSEMYWAEQIGALVLESDKTLLATLSEDLLVS